VDDEFEGQDAQGKVSGQRSPAEHNIFGQATAAPSCQDRLRNVLNALVDGIGVGDRGFDARGDAEAGDGVDEMVGEGLHIPVATGRRPVEVVVADRLDDMVQHGQCLFGTGEFVHGLSC
jgi:hypothetical protein